MRRCHTSHGSTLLARDAQTPGRTTATRAGRTNGRANARRQVRHSVEQLAAAEGAQRDNWPLVTSCNGKAPARSSRAAREWYQPSLPQSTFSTGRPSLGGRFRLLLLLSRFNTGTISPPQPIVKGVQEGNMARICPFLWFCIDFLYFCVLKYIYETLFRILEQ